MKLIRCKYCGDVIALYKDRWRRCLCKASGGQYNEDNQTAIVGGQCEVIGIRNDFFEYKPHSKERREDGRNVIIEAEYKGDDQITRIKSASGPNILEKTYNILKKIL